jgi:hypothetical protein
VEQKFLVAVMRPHPKNVNFVERFHHLIHQTMLQSYPPRIKNQPDFRGVFRKVEDFGTDCFQEWREAIVFSLRVLPLGAKPYP